MAPKRTGGWAPLILPALAACAFAAADSFPRVDAAIAAYETAVRKMQDEFALSPAAPRDKAWAARRLAHMARVDQFTREQSDIPAKERYTPEEAKLFQERFRPKWKALDISHASELKQLLAVHGWFTIGSFGKQADADAWLLVQHADHDLEFQKQILAKLESLRKSGETKPSHYAYLYDRVAVNEKRPQRYGTQGVCVGPGKWEPLPLEKPDRVDELRKAEGLMPLEDYRKGFATLCP